jgi:dynamin-binding protein
MLTQKLYDSFKGPAALITKHNRKAVDFARYASMKAKDEVPDKKLVESAETFQALHASLLEELPVFLSLSCEFIEAIVHQFSIAQAGILPLGTADRKRGIKRGRRNW